MHNIWTHICYSLGILFTYIDLLTPVARNDRPECRNLPVKKGLVITGETKTVIKSANKNFISWDFNKDNSVKQKKSIREKLACIDILFLLLFPCIHKLYRKCRQKISSTERESGQVWVLWNSSWTKSQSGSIASQIERILSARFLGRVRSSKTSLNAQIYLRWPLQIPRYVGWHSRRLSLKYDPN